MTMGPPWWTNSSARSMNIATDRRTVSSPSLCVSTASISRCRIEARKQVGEPALFRRDAGLAALKPSFHRGDRLVRPHEAYFEPRRRLGIAEIERLESRDAKPHVNVRAAIREFKLRLQRR